MRLQLPTPSRPKRLIVEIAGVSQPLVEQRIPLTNRKDLIWHLWTDEFWTPASLPLNVSITLGAKNGLQVWSAKALMLDVGLADLGIHVKLRLPTDEMLWVYVDERDYGDAAAD